MGINFLVMSVISVALMFAYRALYKPSASKESISRDDQPTTLATRGEYLNYVMGTYRTGYLFGRAWGHRTKEVGGGRGKDFGGGGNIPGQTIHYESGWHQIGLGPATTLHQIEENGQVIWKGPIHSHTTPSGSSFAVSGHGTFRIYWGESTQPIDMDLKRNMPDQVGSQYPFLFHIVWIRKKLGTTKTWGQIEYVWTSLCPGNQLADSDLVVEDPENPEVWGVNPAHAMYQLLTAQYPFGVGIPAANIDKVSLEGLGQLMEDEILGLNMQLEQGAESKRHFEAILMDYGVAMVQSGRFLMCLAQRNPPEYEADSVPVLTEDVVAPPSLRRKVNHADNAINVPVFTFKNQRGPLFEFRTDDVATSDDAMISRNGNVQSERILMNTITHGPFALRVALRREQEVAMTSSISVKCLRAARMFLPGELFVLGDSRYRISSVSPSFDGPEVDIDATLDLYGGAALPVPDWINPYVPPLPALEDVDFRWVEVPTSLSGTSRKSIAVFRTRAHQQINGSAINVSSAGGSYFVVGNQSTSAAGGLIETDIGSTSPGGVLEDGPVFEDENGDAMDSLDLTGDTAAWENGMQIALIDDEIFFVRSLQAQGVANWIPEHYYYPGEEVIPPPGLGTEMRYVCVSGGTSGAVSPSWPSSKSDVVEDGDVIWEARHFRYALKGMMRAQYGTSSSAHAIGSRVFLIPSENVNIITHALISPSASICVKSVPFTTFETVNISSITPECDTISI